MGFIKIKKAFILLTAFIFAILFVNLTIKHQNSIPNVEYFSKIINDANENIMNSLNNFADPMEVDVIDIIAIDNGKKMKTVEKNMTIDPIKEKKVTKPSVFCIIKTHPENIENNKSLTVFNVWARKCDNYR